MRLLLVDDEANIRDSAREWLELSGFAVAAAADAEAALLPFAARGDRLRALLDQIRQRRA